jgi:hypothetical protein
MISHWEQAQRPRVTAQSPCRLDRSEHTLHARHQHSSALYSSRVRVAGSDPHLPRLHARSTGCAPQNEEPQPVATTRRHDVTRRGHLTVAQIGCRGASGLASSDGSGGEGGATAARVTAAQRQPPQLGRR